MSKTKQNYHLDDAVLVVVVVVVVIVVDPVAFVINVVDFWAGLGGDVGVGVDIVVAISTDIAKPTITLLHIIDLTKFLILTCTRSMR